MKNASVGKKLIIKNSLSGMEMIRVPKHGKIGIVTINRNRIFKFRGRKV